MMHGLAAFLLGNDVDLHTIEICAGVGMLGEGLRAGLAYLGIAHRTVAYLEREAYAASVLVARMQEGSLDEAPVWPDLLTFDGRPWRGVVDCVAAGFPCQDLSLAGRRAGLDGARSGLFFNILDIADACGARYLFLENVAGIASATATVMDEAEGELLERAAARILGELADRGWNAEWLPLSASDVGASHGRARWFCWAWRRVANTEHSTRRAEHEHQSGQRCTQGPDYRAESGGVGEKLLADPQRPKRWPERAGVAGAIEGHDAGRRQADCGLGIADAVLGLAAPTRHGRHQERTESGREQGRPDAAECCGTVADPGCPRCQGAELRTAHNDNRGGQETHGPADQLCGLFAPGPADPCWAGILAGHPHLAPALEPTFRGVVNGLAFDMADGRAARLKCVGNGVVPLAAAAAVVVLLRRAEMVKQQPAPVAARNQIKEAA